MGMALKGFGNASLGILLAALAGVAHAQEAVATAAPAGGGPKPRGEWQFEVGINSNETYTDNVALSSAHKQSDFVTDVSPYVSAKKDGAHLKVDARYAMQNLFYLNDSSRNTVYHQLASHANAELLPKNLFLDVAANVSQQQTSALAASGVDNTNATGNTTNVYNLTITPYWQQRFGSAATLFARYSHAENRNSGSVVSNNATDSLNVGVNSGSDFKQLSWGVNYAEQQVNNVSRSDTAFNTISGNLGYALTSHLKATLTGGYEDNQYEATGGNTTKGGFWDARITWVPGRLSKYELGYGDHYYGKNIFGSFTHQTPHTTWDVSYTEAVTTSSSNSAYNNGTNNFVYQTNSSLTAGTLSTQGNLQSNSVYLDRTLRGTFTYKRGRGDFSIGIEHARRKGQEAVYNSATNTFDGCTVGGGGNSCGSSTTTSATTNTIYNEIKTVGIRFHGGWKLSSATTGNVDASATRNTFPELSRQDDLRTLSLGVTHVFLRNVNGGVSVRHQTRSSDGANGDFTENAVSASLSAHF